MSTAQQTTSEADRIPLRQLAAYGAGGIIPIALFNIAGILVGLMGNISLGLSAFWLGVILIVPRLWDAVADPVIGHLSDNTRTRWGRRRPYLLVGGILVAVFFVVMWWIPKGDTIRSWFPTESSYHWFQLAYILFSLTLFFTSVTIFEIPHGALGAEMTTDSHQRTRLFSAKSFVGNLFAMSTPWLFVLANMERFKGPGGNEADGMRYVSLMVAAIIVPLSFWWFFTLREPGFAKASQQQATPFWQDMKRTVRNRNFIHLTLTIFTLSMGFNFVQLLGSYIPIFYVFGGDKAAGARLLGINGTVWAISGLLAVFPLNWISPRLGKRNTLVVAILLIAMAQVSKVVCYNPSHPFLIVIPTILLSCGMLFFFTLGSSMVGDICDEDELQTGHRAEGSYYSVFWWFIKMGTALASLISGALIVLTMFDETQVTKVDKLQGDVRDMRAEIESFRAHEHPDAGRTRLSTALAESSESLTQLTKESAPIASPETALERDRRAALAQTLSASRALAAELEHIRAEAGSTPNAAIAQRIELLRMRIKLERAKLDAALLVSYLRTRATSAKSSEHYRSLARTTEQIGATLSRISGAPDIDAIDAQLATIEAPLVQLTQQPPYTLLMMRIVEIGLPLLACIFALLSVLRYALTETRNREIKDLLARRHAEHADPAAV
jgi:glycoside/pentoside/hexuronide:cation symporter, GPH family